jgi:hypothetical protein
MPSIAFLVFTTLLLLALLGASAGVLLESKQEPSRPVWQNPALRDTLLPVAGWCSLFVLDFAVTLIGIERLRMGFKHLLGTLALLLFYYAVLSTLYLIYRSGRRIRAHFASNQKSADLRIIPFLGRLAFPIMFVSAALAAISVLYYDGPSQNFLFIACIVAVTAIIPRRARLSARTQR